MEKTKFFFWRMPNCDVILNRENRIFKAVEYSMSDSENGADGEPQTQTQTQTTPNPKKDTDLSRPPHPSGKEEKVSSQVKILLGD